MPSFSRMTVPEQANDGHETKLKSNATKAVRSTVQRSNQPMEASSYDRRRRVQGRRPEACDVMTQEEKKSTGPALVAKLAGNWRLLLFGTYL